MNYRQLQALLIFLFAVFFTFQGYSQHTHEEDSHNHEKDHTHKKNEVSVAVGVVPLPEENKVTAGLHFHYVRGIGSSNRFGIGVGFETIFDEHKHYTFSVVFQYRIYKGLIFGYAPGLLIKKEDSESELHFAQHFELAYEFDMGKFHIGPMAEVGLEGSTVHYMLGVHFGIDF